MYAIIIVRVCDCGASVCVSVLDESPPDLSVSYTLRHMIEWCPKRTGTTQRCGLQAICGLYKIQSNITMNKPTTNIRNQQHNERRLQ